MKKTSHPSWDSTMSTRHAQYASPFGLSRLGFPTSEAVATAPRAAAAGGAAAADGAFAALTAELSE